MEHSPKRDLVHILAQHAAGLTYAMLPLQAREAAKKSIIDTLGVMLAASGMEPAMKGVIDIVSETGGSPQCSIVGFGGRAPAIMAALANGSLAHCLDYDDQTPWGQHTSSSIVPAVFAVAERQGGITGQDLIAAVAAGQDIFARLRRNVSWKKDWNLSTVLAVFAATASAGRAAGMNEATLTHALGIASMQSSGIMEMIAGRGSDLRGLYAGFSAKGAVLATLLAEKGLTGIDRMFEGRYGFLNTYFPGGYDREGILHDLGTEFMGSGTLYKRWPCVGTAHSHMKAAIDIVSENNLDAGDIEKICLHVGDYHDLMCQPMDERRAPATLADAKFSLPFLVAVAVVRRGMSVSDFSQAGLGDPTVLEIARKITLTQDPALDWKMELPPGRVEISTHDGRCWIVEGRMVPGNADSPMKWDDILNKFRECALAAHPSVPLVNVAKTETMVLRLEEIEDAAEIVRGLSPQNPTEGPARFSY